MKRGTLVLIALVLLTTATMTPRVAEGAPGWTPQRIEFAPGAIAATRYGALPMNGTNQWVAKIMGGQTLTVQLTPNDGTVLFRLTGANGAVLADQRAFWSGTVPATQDYYITVQAYYNAAPRYALTVAAPPAPVPEPAPQRRNYNGTFDAHEYIVELNQAIGCTGATCAITGRLIQITTGAPVIANIQGTANAVNGAIYFYTDLAGGQTFNGTIDAYGQTLTGTLSGHGPVRFVRR